MALRINRLVGIMLPLLEGTLFADTGEPTHRSCCGQVPSLIVGLDTASYWMKADEIVEALPEYAADHLSYLTWSAGSGVLGINLSFRPWGFLRANGGFWFLTETELGKLVNLDYLDPLGDDVTHRSVSASDFSGAGWQASLDLIVAENTHGDLFVQSFARLGYRGNYHFWKARGGEYEYPDGRGSFDDDEYFVRYVVLHQVFDLGGFVTLGHAQEGFYVRTGGSVSYLTWVDDRDTHIRRNTDYYNTYRWGWYVRPEVAFGAEMGQGFAVEAFYEPELQFAFDETKTNIRTRSTVRTAAERPNYNMTLHRLGIRLLWSLL